MNIAILDREHGGWTPPEIGVLPLSAEAESVGSLAIALADCCHRVVVYHRTERPGVYGGVSTVRSIGLSSQALVGVDALIAVGVWDASVVEVWRKTLGTRAIVGWSPEGDPRIADAPMFGFAFSSEWALQAALRRKVIPPNRVSRWRPVLLPGFGPGLGEIPAGRMVAGGPWLSRLWPALRAAVPGVRGVVFGGAPADGLVAVPDPSPSERARLLGDVAVWVEAPEADPPASRSVLEALASGCEVVALQRGGLAEAGAGFARLVGPPWHDVDGRIVRRVVDALDREPSRALASVGWAAATCAPSVRAEQVTRDLLWLRSS